MEFHVEPRYNYIPEIEVDLYGLQWCTWEKGESKLLVNDKVQPLKSQLRTNAPLGRNWKSRIEINDKRVTGKDSIWLSVFSVVRFNGMEEDDYKMRILEDKVKDHNYDIEDVDGQLSVKENLLYYYQIRICDVYIKITEIMKLFKDSAEKTNGESIVATTKRSIIDSRLKDATKLGTDHSYERGTLEFTFTIERSIFESLLQRIGYSFEPEANEKNITRDIEHLKKFVLVGGKESSVSKPYGTKYIRQYSNTVAKYVEEYIGLFSNIDTPFKTIYEVVHNTKASLDAGRKLIPLNKTVTFIHAPVFVTDFGSLPLIYYYLHTTDPKMINQRHEMYLLACAKSVVEQNGYTTEWVSSVIKEFFGSDERVKRSNIPLLLNMMICLDLFCEFVTLPSQNAKYRRDFRNKSNSSIRNDDSGYVAARSKSLSTTVPVESFDFDLSCFGSGCDDCEGCDKLSNLMFHLIESGKNGTKNKRYSAKEDSEYGILNAYFDVIETKYNSWDYPVLNAFQDIALYYVNASTVVSTTTDGADDESLIHEVNSQVEYYYGIGNDHDINGTFSAHMFSLIIPWDKMCEFISKSPKGSSYGTIARLGKLFSKGTKVLPVLTLESTGRARSFLTSATFTIRKHYGDSLTNEDIELLDEVCKTEKAMKNTHIKLNRSQFSRNVTGDDAYNVRRYSPLTWFHGDKENLHVSTFYRTAAHFVSPKTFKIHENLGNLAWIDLNKNRWGRNIASIIRDDNGNTALLPYLDRISDGVRRELKESVPTILDLLPPVKFGSFEGGYRCTKMSVSEWVARELKDSAKNGVDFRSMGSFKSIDISAGGDPYRFDNSQFYTIRYFIPRAFTTPADVKGMVNYIASIAASGILVGACVYDQQFFPIFGRDEYVICIRLSNVDRFYSLHK